MRQSWDTRKRNCSTKPVGRSSIQMTCSTWSRSSSLQSRTERSFIEKNFAIYTRTGAWYGPKALPPWFVTLMVRCRTSLPELYWRRSPQARRDTQIYCETYNFQTPRKIGNRTSATSDASLKFPGWSRHRCRHTGFSLRVKVQLSLTCFLC